MSQQYVYTITGFDRNLFQMWTVDVVFTNREKAEAFCHEHSNKSTYYCLNRALLNEETVDTGSAA